MNLVRVHELTCAFCKKSQRDVKALIASHDNHAYICDQCTDFGRLKPVGCEFRCSFCGNKKSTSGFDAYALRDETDTRICDGCLDVCRQILKGQDKRDPASQPQPI